MALSLGSCELESQVKRRSTITVSDSSSRFFPRKILLISSTLSADSNEDQISLASSNVGSLAFSPGTLNGISLGKTKIAILIALGALKPGNGLFLGPGLEMDNGQDIALGGEESITLSGNGGCGLACSGRPRVDCGVPFHGNTAGGSWRMKTLRLLFVEVKPEKI